MAIPNPPSNLVATPITASRIDLRWQDNSSNEVEFELERSTTGVGDWEQIATPAANATSYSDTDLPASSDFYYRILATNGDGDSAYSAVASVLAIFAGRVLTPRLYLLQPEIVFAARVNSPSTPTYPATFVAFDTVTTGAYTDISAGMTLLLGSAPGLDDYGRQRVKSATAVSIFVGRSSRGTNDGELTVVDNAYVTVWNDRRVWAKVPYINASGEIFKDGDLEVGDNTTDPPPVANTGPPQAGTIDPDTEVITVTLDAQESFAVADAATIASYLWDIDDGTLVGMSALTDESITVTFPAGFRYVSLTVTDSNAKTHTAYVAIYARDPDNDTSFDAFQIESRRATEGGVSMTIRILEDMPRATYPDGTLAMMWDEEPAGRPLLMFGWLDSENAAINAGRNGLLRDTTLTILDVANKLDALPGFPQSVADDDTRDTDLLPNITWSYMVDPNLDKYLHYLLHWHSTALEVADFVWSGTTTEYPFVLLSSDGDSLWNQVDRRARAFVPDRVLTCSPSGEIRVVPDPQLQDPDDRTSVVQANILESSWSDLRFEYRRAPRVHWLRAGAILAGDTEPIGTVFSIAPGDTPGQGVGEVVQGEQLALSQEALNAATGHRYARVNSRYGLLTLTLIQDDDSNLSVIRWRNIDPSAKEWVTLTVSAATAAQRGLTFSTVRCLPKEVNERYNHDRTGLTRTVTLTLEVETVGEPGQTVVKPEVPAVGENPPPPPPTPPPFDGGLRAGIENVCLISRAGALYRTSDFQTPDGSGGPTWDKRDLGLPDDTIYSWVVDPFSPLYTGVEENPDEPLPLWAVFTAGPNTIDVLHYGAAGALTSYVSDSDGGAAVVLDQYLWLAPPPNAVRVVVEGTWLCVYSEPTPSSGTVSGNMSIADALEISRTDDFAFSDPPTSNDSTSGSFTAEFTLTFGADWPVNTANVLSSVNGDAVRFRCRSSVSSSNPFLVACTTTFRVRVTEIELDNGHIYRPAPKPGSVNSFFTTQNYVYRLDDMFGTEPVVTQLHDFAFAADTSSQLHRTIQASFGRFFEAESDNPWLGVVSYYRSTSGHTGTWALRSLDAGKTWEEETQISEHYENDTTGGRMQIGLYLSPKTPGRAYTAAYAATGGFPNVYAGKVSEDWMETWNDIANPAISPLHQPAGDIHVPWPHNDDEDIVYYGRTDRSAETSSLIRATGTLDEDVSPTPGAFPYGINLWQSQSFQVRTFDLNRQYVLLAGYGNDTMAGDWYGIFVSDDYGDTWTVIATPVESVTDVPAPLQAAFGGDSQNIIYTWGEYGYVAYSEDFGSSFDEKIGNLATIEGDGGPPRTFIGLAGGDAPE